MATNTKTSTISAPPSIEFEPYCEWRKEQEPATLVFRLPGMSESLIILFYFHLYAHFIVWENCIELISLMHI